MLNPQKALALIMKAPVTIEYELNTDYDNLFYNQKDFNKHKIEEFYLIADDDDLDWDDATGKQFIKSTKLTKKVRRAVFPDGIHVSLTDFKKFKKSSYIRMNANARTIPDFAWEIVIEKDKLTIGCQVRPWHNWKMNLTSIANEFISTEKNRLLGIEFVNLLLTNKPELLAKLKG